MFLIPRDILLNFKKKKKHNQKNEKEGNIMLSRDALSPRSVSLTNSDSSASSDGGFCP